MITKTDFKLYLEAPMHLWAKKRAQFTPPETSPFAQHLLAQGMQIEALAREYLSGSLLTQFAGASLSWQPTFQDGAFEARLDLLLFDSAAQAYDLYEIKSSTSLKKEHQMDAAFQALVCAASLPLRDVYLVHVNPQYLNQGELDPAAFFVAERITQQVNARKPEIEPLRREALRVAGSDDPGGIEGCTDPETCPCPNLCHPGLPEGHIYDLNRLGKKALDLKQRGILSLAHIPPDFPLNELQKRQVQAARQSRPLIDHRAIRRALDQLVYPLYFLDYETFNPALPLFPGYRPYQHIVYQYSLHALASPNGQLEHHELLLSGPGDPGPELLERLASQLGASGKVVVWYQPFEAGRNREMASTYPAYRVFLEGLNDRLFDLMEIFSQGYYVDAGFRGSASLKNVLPVLAPELSYAGLAIASGEECSLAWWQLFSGTVPQAERESMRADMLAYCALDSLAMVKIWEKLVELVGG